MPSPIYDHVTVVHSWFSSGILQTSCRFGIYFLLPGPESEAIRIYVVEQGA